MPCDGRGVVPGRAQGEERGVGRAVRRARRSPRSRCPAAVIAARHESGGDDGVGVEQPAARRGSAPRATRGTAAGWTRSSSAAVASRGRQRDQRVAEPGPLDAVLAPRASRAGRSGWPAPGVVQREHRVRGHEEHPRTVTQPGIAGIDRPTLAGRHDRRDPALAGRMGAARLLARAAPTWPTSPSGPTAPRPPRSWTAASGCCAAAGTRPSSPARSPPPTRCPFLDAGFSVRERLHLLAHSMGDLPQPAPLHPAGPQGRPRRGARARPPSRSTASGGSTTTGSTQRDRGHPVEPLPRRGRPTTASLAYAVTGRAGQHGYLQRARGPPRRRAARATAARRARRAALAPPPRRDPGARQHPARQRRRARALRVVRLPRAARPGCA